VEPEGAEETPNPELDPNHLVIVDEDHTPVEEGFLDNLDTLEENESTSKKQLLNSV